MLGAVAIHSVCDLFVSHSLQPPSSLRHFVTQGLLPPVLLLGCGSSLLVCGFVNIFDGLID